jgi:hypothetical protein
MLGGPRKLSGDSGALTEPALGRTMSGFVNVGEGSEGNEGSGFSIVICGESERSKGPSHDTMLMPAEIAKPESYRAAMMYVLFCDGCDCDCDWYRMGV